MRSSSVANDGNFIITTFRWQWQYGKLCCKVFSSLTRSWWRHDMDMLSTLLAFCEENLHQSLGNSFDIFVVVSLNMLLNKWSSCSDLTLHGAYVSSMQMRWYHFHGRLSWRPWKWYHLICTEIINIWCMILMEIVNLITRTSLPQTINTMRPRQNGSHFPSNIFRCIFFQMFEFRFRFHWSLFLKVQLTIFQDWFI